MRSGYQETIIHASAGIALLQTSPEDVERCRRELNLQLVLGPATMAAKGYGATEVVRVYSRARDLCQQMGDTTQLIPVLVGLGRAARIRAELHTAQATGEQVFTLAQRVKNDNFWILAHCQCA